MATESSSSGADNADLATSFAANVRHSLFKGFAIPVILLAFFFVAPWWLNQKVHSDLNEGIAASTSLKPEEKAQVIANYGRINFAEVCGAANPELARLRAWLEENELCGQFQRLAWARRASVLLVALLGFVTLATFTLNRQARRSRPDLIRTYRLGWRLGITAALAKVFLLVPLLTYGLFELTTLAAGRYFPQLIGAIAIGGLIALWRSAKILLQRVPMEFEETMARAVTPGEAPELWAAVRAAAARLQTAPPDHIVVGMQLNFYVTELAVKHGGGRAEGRTLYLSQPMLNQLATDEVLAIIGHELGHFRGEDTRITREFYPLRFKVGATMQALAEAGWAGWPSLHALLFFHWTFESTEQAMSRERELLADRTAAELTSAGVAAQALIKVHVVGEAFARGSIGADGLRTELPFDAPLAPFIRDRVPATDDFWTRLFARRAPHPLDSHPSLAVRLAALGQVIDPAYARTLAMSEQPSAQAQWFAGRESLFAAITQQAKAQLEEVRVQAAVVHANYETEAGREMLDRHFPERRWRVRPIAFWFQIGSLGGLAVGSLLLIKIAEHEVLTTGLVIAAVGLLAWAASLWKRHRGSELVLRADSLSYGGWKRPLLFANVKTITVLNQSGSLTVTYVLNTAEPWIWKYSLVSWYRSKQVSFTLSFFAGKQSETLQTLARYLARQIEP